MTIHLSQIHINILTGWRINWQIRWPTNMWSLVKVLLMVIPLRIN